MDELTVHISHLCLTILTISPLLRYEKSDLLVHKGPSHRIEGNKSGVLMDEATLFCRKKMDVTPERRGGLLTHRAMVVRCDPGLTSRPRCVSDRSQTVGQHTFERSAVEAEEGVSLGAETFRAHTDPRGNRHKSDFAMCSWLSPRRSSSAVSRSGVRFSGAHRPTSTLVSVHQRL